MFELYQMNEILLIKYRIQIMIKLLYKFTKIKYLSFNITDCFLR